MGGSRACTSAAVGTSLTSAVHHLSGVPRVPAVMRINAVHVLSPLTHCLRTVLQEVSAAAKKKLKKKSKKAGADADADADAEAVPAPGKKAAGGKKPSAAVRKMQEALERQQRLQEEARLAAEEAARKVPPHSHAGWVLCRMAACALRLL